MKFETELKTKSQIEVDNNAHKNRMHELTLTEGVKENIARDSNMTKVATAHLEGQTKTVHKGIDAAIAEDKIDLEHEKLEVARESAKNKPTPTK